MWIAEVISQSPMWEPQITELIKPAKVDERMNKLSACSSKEKLFNHRLQLEWFSRRAKWIVTELKPCWCIKYLIIGALVTHWSEHYRRRSVCVSAILFSPCTFLFNESFLDKLERLKGPLKLVPRASSFCLQGHGNLKHISNHLPRSIRVS